METTYQKKLLTNRNTRQIYYGIATFFFFLVVVPITNSAEYIFRPKGCEYSVIFPSAPKIEEYDSFPDDDECNTKDAQLLLWNGAGVLRAECTTCNNYSSIREHDKKTIITELMLMIGAIEPFRDRRNRAT